MTWGSAAIALAVVLTDVVVRGLRLRELLGRRIALRDAVFANQVGELASAVTPARIGGEPARFAELKRLDHGTRAIMATLVTEKVVDYLLIGTVLGSAALFMGPQVIEGMGDRVATLQTPLWFAVAVMLIAAMGVSWWWAGRRAYKAHPKPRGVRAIGRELRRLPATVGLTITSMALRTAVLPILAWPLLADSWGIAALGSFALLYSQLVLPTPSGAGVVEAGFVAGMGPLSDAATVASILIAWRALTIGVGALIGAGVLVRRGAHVGSWILQPTRHRIQPL